ncbi:MAG TPA: hypothetical protein PKC60_00930 [Hydrogenophaga sp.]|uniref:hypothetical protein n=1 Tax=Hydrogenophaga sp. TaxID=1904254 RepID=UPI002C63CCF0|nr:hypothetical protein [Hydrogenophaga sp.]HMN91768.1 hypothetical protein [Hydrogenophaga sp.]HMP10089.1 hypothetical protein [Hydrogenophaga sp.]
MPFSFPFPEPAWREPWRGFLARRCAQRILIVTDAFGSFDPGSAIGLTELIRVLQGNAEVPMAMPTTITQASTASGFDFARASPPVTTAHYDQVWLFGFVSGAPGLSPAERKVLTRFMDAGGGVFATGDHSSIGQVLCGGLPRVRKMREWSAVPMSGPSRIDTVNHPGVDGIARDTDQADHFPQTTYPLLRGVGPGATPHPLLQSPHGAINVLPDHPHESECYAPRGADLDGNYTVPAQPGDPALSITEFPLLAGQRHGPEIVAIAMSASLNVDKGAVSPRCFGAISAYDGHLVQVGRVVCDATWHHFVNMNLNGAGYPGNGLREGMPLAPNAAYLQIQRYFANIADWLTPRTRRWCFLFDRLVLSIYSYPFLEEVLALPDLPRPLPPSPPWPLLVQVGAVIRDDLQHRQGQGAFNRFGDELLLAMDLPTEMLLPLLHGGAGADQSPDQRRLPALDPADAQELRLGLVGGVLLRAWSSLPADPAALAKRAEALHKQGPKPYREGLVRDLRTAMEALRTRHESQVKVLGGLAKVKL